MVNALLFKLMFRELKKNWYQYLAMFLITVLATTLFLGFVSNSLTLRRRAERYYEAANLADLIVQTTGFDDADVAYLDGLGAEYRIYSEGSFSKPGGTPDTARFYIGDGQLNKPYLTEGKAGILVDARVAELHGYRVGDSIVLRLTSLEDAFSSYGIEPAFEAEITGLMHSVEGVNIYSVSPLVIAPDVFEEKVIDLAMRAFNFDLANENQRGLVRQVVEPLLPRLRTQAVLKAESPAAVKEEIRAHFAEKGGASNLVSVFDHGTMEAVVTIDSEVDQSLNMLYVFPVIFFFVSLLVVTSSVSRLILRERIQIGTLKALGIKNGRIIVHYATLSAVVALVGCLVGAALGPLIVPTVMNIKYGIVFSMPMLSGTAFSFGWTAATLAVVSGASFAIGAAASRSVVCGQPAECMRPKPIAYHPRVGGKSKGIDPRRMLSFRMALRNLRINIWRPALTVLGIAGCSALLLTSFGIGDTLDASVQNDFGNLFTFDVIAPYTSVVEARLGEMDGDDAFGVEKKEIVETYVSVAEHGGVSKDVTVYLLPADCEMSSVLTGENALSRSVAEELGVEVGDTVLFTAGGDVCEITVRSIVETAAWNGFFTRERPFAAQANAQNVWIKTSRPDAVRDALNEAAGMTVAKTMEDRLDEIGSVISSTSTMKYTLMAFAVLLSVVVLYNLSLLNVRERARDMATMKVLGFTHFKIALSLVFEIMILTCVGTALGCACGLPLLTLVMKINKVSVINFLVALRPVSYLYAILLSAGTSAVIYALFGVVISRISMTESLKSVE